MCCGRNHNRVQYSAPNSAPNHLTAASLPVNVGLQSGSTFQYVGRTALTVVGPVSGARYRFERPGSQVRVDPRDRSALLRVPALRPVG
jgi:hypothetical protein